MRPCKGNAVGADSISARGRPAALHHNKTEKTMIHQYKLSGYNIVLDVYSGSVHAVDDVAYDAIALIDQGSSREQAAAALAKKYADRADVTAADISAEAIAMAQRNAQRNGLTNMDFLCEDTFELLPRLEREGHPYDFIILDPPAFTKARRTVENAMRGYKEINYRAMKLLPRGGYLATASCSHFATEELFIKMLRAAAKDAHRQLRQIEVKQQAPDHPILWGVPETNYLKFFLFQVI